MKILLLSAAVLSFLFCAAGGGVLLSLAITSPLAAPVLAAAGLFFVGCGVFLGAILVAAAHRVAQKE
jgi:hypothetical protein